MGRGKNRGGKKWNRKRKADEKSAKSGKERTNGAGDYHATLNSNAKFEAYYSYVGLHSTRYDEEAKEFVPCTNDEEKHAERDRFMNSMCSILPASFRVDRSLDSTIQTKILEELQQFVGKEMEVEIELPRRSEAIGGMKDLLEKGGETMTTATDAGKGEKEEEKEGKEDGDESKKEDVDAKDAKDAKEPAEDAADATTNGDKTSNNDKDKDKDNSDNAPIIVKKTIAPAKPIPFICNSNDSTVLGYQLSVDRRTLRRNKSLEPLHNWLKIHTDCGHITRQETVSMIPPVVLNAQEGMAILDMCAAPGSKTCQLLEVAGGIGNSSPSPSNDGDDGKDEEKGQELEPKGYVVANDADPKRAYMLVRQLRRMNSPAVFVTSCDGQYFPILDDDKAAKGTMEEGTFHRVLADVPCSGDGTIRKNPGIWKHWNQLGSLALHPLQLSIALRGARLTRVGGYLVYSTCSMNPVENESVVAELLRIGEGALVLEDPRSRMEGLVARPGWSSWRVLRENKNRTRRAMKDWKKKNNAKMLAKRKEWEEKKAKEKEEAGENDGTNGEKDGGEEEEGPPAKEAKLDENQTAGGGGGEEKKEEAKEEKYAPSPYETIPYVPPKTWDDEALRERTTSLGFVEYASYDEVEPEWRRRVRGSCFPPTEEEAKEFELHKCLRCLPQDMDTGGFFVALLKKVKPLSKNATDRMNMLARESRGGVEVDAHLCKTGDEEKDARTGSVEKEGKDVNMTESSAVEDTADAEPANGRKEEEDKSKEEESNKKEEIKEKEEPIQKAPMGKVGMHHKHQKKADLSKEDFVPCGPTLWPPIVEEYGLAPTFPKDQFMIRASGEAKVLYFISKSVKEDLIDRGIQDRVTVINSGLKAFERCSLQEKNVIYRLSQEGIQYVVPYVTKRIISASMDDFYKCVQTGFISFDKFSEPFQKGLEGMGGPGSFLVTLEGCEKDYTKKMYLSMWLRSNKAVNCFVTKIEMDAILSKMGALGYVAPNVEDEEKAEAVSGLVEKAAVEDKMDVSS